MKQKILLFAILFASLAFTQQVKADWTGSTVTTGTDTCYVLNVGQKLFLTQGGSWGTQAKLADEFMPIEIVNNSGLYSLHIVDTYNNATDRYLGTGGYIDGAQPTNGWTIAPVEGKTNVYTLAYGDVPTYFGFEGESSSYLDGVSDNANYQWMFITKSELIDSLANATVQDPKEATFYIKSPKIHRNNSYYTKWNNYGTVGGNDNANWCMEKYYTNFDTYQTLTNIPNGTYKLSVDGFYRHGITPGTDREAGTEVLYAELYALSNSVTAVDTLMSILDGATSTSQSGDVSYGSLYIPNNMAGAGIHLANGDYSDNYLYVSVTDGTLQLGIKKNTTIASDWVIFDNFKLYYYGNATTPEDAEYYDKNRALIASIDELQALIDQANALSGSADATAAAKLSTAITAAQAAVDAPTAENLAAAKVDLPRAILYYQATLATEAAPVDVTSLFVTNPNFDGSSTGWSGDFVYQGSGYPNGDCSVSTFIEKWAWGSAIPNYSGYQTLTDIPNGTYILKAACIASWQSDAAVTVTGVNLFANDSTTAVATANEKPQWFSVEVFVVDNSLTIGIETTSATNANWVGMDNVSLTYKGLDITSINTRYDALRAQIATNVLAAEVPTACINMMSDTLTVYPVATPSDLNVLLAGIKAFSAALAEYNIYFSASADTRALISTCETIRDHSTANDGLAVGGGGTLNTFATAIATAITNAQAQTSTDYTSIYNTLDTARQTYVMVAVPNSGYTFDMSFLIKNRDLTSGTDEWTNDGFQAGTSSVYSNGDCIISTFIEKWVSGAGLSDASIYQTLSNVPNGVYELTAACIATRQDNADPKGYTTGVYLYGNSYSKSVATGNGIPEWFTAEIIVSEQTLQVGIKTVSTTANWVALDNVSLVFKGIDLTALTEKYDSLYSCVKAFTTDGSVPAGYVQVINDSLSHYSVTAPTDFYELGASNSALEGILNSCKDMAKAYAEFNAFITSCEDIRDHSTADDGKAVDQGGTLNTFATAISTAITTANAKTTADFSSIYNTLEAARQTYVRIADPIDGYTFDMTFLITNPNFDTNDDTGWQTDDFWYQGAGYSYNGCSVSKFMENWGAYSPLANSDISQTLYLTNGIYNLTAACIGTCQGNVSPKESSVGCYLFANDSTKAVATGNELPEWFTISNINVTNGTLKIGVKIISNTVNWVAVDNFKLTYAGYDKTTSLTALQVLVDSAGTLLTNGYMNSQVEVNLGSEKSQAETIITIDNANNRSAIIGATNELLDAINSANASIKAFADLNAAISKVSTLEASFPTGIYEDIYDDQDSEDYTVISTTEALYAAFEKYVTDNNDQSNPADMSDYYLINPDFTEGTTGWTCSWSQTNAATWGVSGDTLNFTPTTGHYYGCATWQAVKLAKGAYKLSARVKAGELAGKESTLFASIGAPNWYGYVDTPLAKEVVSTFDEWTIVSIVFALDADATVNIGFNTMGNNSASAAFASYAIDYFTLTQAKNQVKEVNGQKTLAGDWAKNEIEALPITSSTTSLDLRQIAVPDGTAFTLTENPNCLIYANEDLGLTQNVVVNDTCANLVIDDSKPFVVPEAFNATHATYTRTAYIDGGYETFFAPIETEAQTGYSYEVFSGYDSGNNMVSFEAAELTDNKLLANTPYLMKYNTDAGDKTTLTITGTANQQVAVTPAQTIVFVGVTKTLNVTADNEGSIYMMNAAGTQFTKAQSGSTIPQFRCYLSITVAEGSSIRIRHDGELTAIEEVEVEGEKSLSNVYSIDGRMLLENVTPQQAKQQLEKGLYIMNGKKIIVK